MTDYGFTYLSFGAGVQSSAMLVLAVQGKIPRPRVAYFADTGDEPSYVYEQLEAMREYATTGAGIPIQTVRQSPDSLSQWNVERQREGKRFVSVPLFTHGSDGRPGGGMLRRQCTREFKIAPIEKAVREALGYAKGQRVKVRARAQIGISIDEAARMKPNRTRWITNTFPLVELGLHRRQCSAIVTGAGLPIPEKSACVFCPYHSDSYWLALKSKYPADFAKAVEFDTQIRDMTARGRKRPVYVHRSCKPLASVDFDPTRDQLDFFVNECEGMCGL